MTIFISYSRANSEFTTRLARDLQKAGFPAWLDQLDIAAGSRWDDEVEKALHSCTVCLFVLSPEAMQSQNVKDEIGYAIDTGKVILPVMIKQCEIPFRLRRFQFVNCVSKPYAAGLNEIKHMLSNTDALAAAAGAPLDTEFDSARPALSDSMPAKKKGQTRAMIIGGALVVLAIFAGIMLFGNRKATPLAPAATQTATMSEATSSPQVTSTATEQNTPTFTPSLTPVPSPFFTEQFDGDASNWSTFVTSGDIKKLDIQVAGGRLAFSLSDPAKDLYAYFILNDFTYTDVKLETTTINKGVNNNDVSLICRYSESGWYEFNLANDQTYTILAYDTIGAWGEAGYNVLFEGASAAIKSGQASNTYAAVCKGNTLALYINGNLVRTIIDNQYNFVEGKIGLSVSSFKALPVIVQFENLIISQPD